MLKIFIVILPLYVLVCFYTISWEYPGSMVIPFYFYVSSVIDYLS